MTRIGITGHASLTPFTRRVVAAELAALLAQRSEVVGFTSLCEGADQLFAYAVLAAGGEINFVQPCADVEDGIAPSSVQHFRALRDVCTATVAALDPGGQPHLTGSQEAYLAAGHAVVDAVDELVAVWDGLPAVGMGGTGDVVAYARSVGAPVTVIWPEGSARS